MFQDLVEGFVARIYKNDFRQTMPYRLFIPKANNAATRYPLILWLHGASGLGTDNLRQISSTNAVGPRLFSSDAVQSKYPSFIFAPQGPPKGAWDATREPDLSADMTVALEIIDALEKEFSVDKSRIYAMGQSLGGYGTWDVISKQPDRFAAGVPLCGGGSVSRAPRLVKLPIWAFHGDIDATVSVSQSRNMIAAIKKAGGNPRYTEYENVGHDVWTRAFAEPGLVDWLFAQHK
jgi:predicted peptidase